MIDTEFAKIVQTSRGDAILLGGVVIEIIAPDQRNDEFVEAIVNGLRRSSRASEGLRAA